MDVFEFVFDWGVDFIYTVLPLSPFQPYIQQLAGLPYLGYLNWFFPIGDAISITAAWLTVVGTWYSWQVLLRWLKIIGD